MVLLFPMEYFKLKKQHFLSLLKSSAATKKKQTRSNFTTNILKLYICTIASFYKFKQIKLKLPNWHKLD